MSDIIQDKHKIHWIQYTLVQKQRTALVKHKTEDNDHNLEMHLR